MSLYLNQRFLNVVCRALRANQKMSQLLIFIPRILTALPARERVVSPSPANELDSHILTGESQVQLISLTRLSFSNHCKLMRQLVMLLEAPVFDEL